MEQPLTKDPDHFNPALRNSAAVLDRTRLERLVEEHSSRSRTVGALTGILGFLPVQVCILGVALEQNDREAAQAAVTSLNSLAAAIGASHLELDGRLIDASLRAGRVQRARRLWPRLGEDITSLAEALSPLLAGGGHQFSALPPSDSGVCQGKNLRQRTDSSPNRSKFPGRR